MTRTKGIEPKKDTTGRARRKGPVNGQREGRPPLATSQGETLLTPELQAQLVRLVQAGNYNDQAAAACGIARSTYYEWLKRGARGEEPYSGLADAVKKAEAQAEARGVAIINKAAETQWQAAAWFLERKMFKRWGRKDALELSGDDDKPIAVKHGIDLKKLSTKQLEQLQEMRAIARSGGEDEQS